MEPPWTFVASSGLNAIAYDPIERRLRIRFRSGAIFEYDGIPSFVYEELLSALSKSGYFSDFIRPDYPYRRVRGADKGIPALAR